MFSKILVPLDGSDNASKALQLAIKLSKQSNASLQLLTVVNTNVLSLGKDPIRPTQTALVDEVKANAEAILADAEKTLANTGTSFDSEVLMGSAKHIIAEDAPTKYGIDAIVIGKSGVDALNKLALGSTTAYVVRNASVPVVVV
ncbi:universal stress protein [Lentilactobacillus sp. Marseille-Q4993]|uniref:universal stress protein n=1 Tax=Lentilactobacillus sp. Marseille-Q4993 TaxID=3039492 RepID=UPI0024BCB4EA|nr:universal stress protein [Lentilactobacillus sp. Marseille-Q4993]